MKTYSSRVERAGDACCKIQLEDTDNREGKKNYPHKNDFNMHFQEYKLILCSNVRVIGVLSNASAGCMYIALFITHDKNKRKYTYC